VADLKKYQAVTVWCARFNVTFGHFLIASKTGVLTVFPLLGITLTGMHDTLLTGGCPHFLSRRVRSSRMLSFTNLIYAGAYTEAALTAAGAFALSVIVSYTPLGKQVDRLAALVHHRE
jgi:hypothetical protein